MTPADLRALLTHRIDAFLYRLIARAIVTIERKGIPVATHAHQLRHYISHELNITGKPEILDIYHECSMSDPDPEEFGQLFFDVFRERIQAPHDMEQITDAVQLERHHASILAKYEDK